VIVCDRPDRSDPRQVAGHCCLFPGTVVEDGEVIVRGPGQVYERVDDRDDVQRGVGVDGEPAGDEGQCPVTGAEGAPDSGCVWADAAARYRQDRVSRRGWPTAPCERIRHSRPRPQRTSNLLAAGRASLDRDHDEFRGHRRARRARSGHRVRPQHIEGRARSLLRNKLGIAQDRPINGSAGPKCYQPAHQVRRRPRPG
jgi:hypothetical protein